jgi:hypothetical protein
MKIMFDPFQAIAAVATGVIVRGLLAAGALTFGAMLGVFPDSSPLDAWVICLLPASIAHLGTLRGFATFVLLCAAWVSLLRFFCFNGGKWTLFTLFATALCSTTITAAWSGRVDFFAFFASGRTDGYDAAKEFDWHAWALVFLVLAAVIVAMPDLINYWVRRTAPRTEEAEETPTASLASTTPPPP